MYRTHLPLTLSSRCAVAFRRGFPERLSDETIAIDRCARADDGRPTDRLSTDLLVHIEAQVLTFKYDRRITHVLGHVIIIASGKVWLYDFLGVLFIHIYITLQHIIIIVIDNIWYRVTRAFETSKSPKSRVDGALLQYLHYIIIQVDVLNQCFTIMRGEVGQAQVGTKHSRVYSEAMVYKIYVFNRKVDSSYTAEVIVMKSHKSKIQ